MEKQKKTKWSIDLAHSKIGFRVRHLMIANVQGTFKEFTGQVTTDGNDFSTASVYISIRSASIDTETPDRDTHLKSADFLDVEKFPEIVFESTRVMDPGDNTYELEGNLVMKGISKKVVLSVEIGGMIKDPWGNLKAGFTVSGKIQRQDWGLVWNAALESGGVLVGNEVRIFCDVEFAQASE